MNPHKKPFNLISCARFFKLVIDNAVNFAEECDIQSLEDLKNARKHYCELKWLGAIAEDLLNNVGKAVDIFNNKIDPIIKDVTETLEQEDNKLYDMWDLNYYDDVPENQDKVLKIDNWANTAEQQEIRKHLKSMRTFGYPKPDNIRPLRELKSPTTSEIEQNFQNDKKLDADTHTYYYEYHKDGVRINLPVIDYLESVPPMFHYYEGDHKHPAGVYMSPYPGVIMQVPSVEVVPYSVQNSNYNSIKCMSGKKCINHKCTYAHPGRDYVKIGCIPRCPAAPSIGNKQTLAEDIKLVGVEDIKKISMYGINDLWVAALFFSKIVKLHELRIVHDTEVCEPITNEEFLKTNEYEETEYIGR